MALPVDIEAARRQLKLEADDASRDDDLNDWIADAAGWVENYTGQALEPRTVEQSFDCFDGIELRAWPVAPAAAVTLNYRGPDGQPVPIAGVRLDITSRPARLWPPLGAQWPLLACASTITVSVQAGYASPDAVPRNMRRAMLILIAAYDQDREGGEVFAAAEAAAKRLLNTYRLRSL